MEDKITNDWKPHVKPLQDCCTKITVKVCGMEETKKENKATKQRIAKLHVEKVEMNNVYLFIGAGEQINGDEYGTEQGLLFPKSIGLGI